MKKKYLFRTLLLCVLMLTGGGKLWADETIYSWVSPSGTVQESGGTIAAGGSGNTDADEINIKQAVNSNNYYCVRLRGAKDFSTYYVTITLQNPLQEGDKIKVTAFRNKGKDSSNPSKENSKSGFKAKFNIGSNLISGGVYDFNNINADPSTSSKEKKGTAPNEVTYDIPSSAVGSNTITITRVETSTNLFITKIEITRAGEDNRSESSVSFGSTTSASVDMAEQSTYQLPTPTTTPANATLTYESNNTAAATVNDQGLVTLVGAGTAKITAKFAGNNSYKPSTAEFTLTIENSNFKIFENAGGEANITNSGMIGFTTKVWDFTNWSEATINNLKADAAASTTKGWSDIEKAANVNDPTKAVEGYFWSVANATVGGELTANGTVIEELKGLVFHNAYSTARSLSIINLSNMKCLWLGGSKKSCFTIKNVKVGSQLTMEVESHKTSEARGVQLYYNSVADNNKIGDAFTPTTKASNTWTVTGPSGAETVDVIVYNTNGCHIYKIEADIAEAKTTKLQMKKDIVIAAGYKATLGNGSIALTFSEEGGEDFKAATASTNINGYVALTEGNGTNGNKAKGTFFTFEPKYPGSIEVGVTIDKNKNLHITEDGTELEGYPVTFDAKTHKAFTFNVVGGKQYKVYGEGTKISFYGFEYKANVAKDIAEFKKYANGSEVLLTLTNAKVTAKSAGNLYYVIEDVSGAMPVIASDLGLAVGKILNGTILLQRNESQGHGATTTANSNMNQMAMADGTVEPTLVSDMSYFSQEENDFRYVKLETVTTNPKSSIVPGVTNYVVNKDGQTLYIANGFYSGSINAVKGKNKLESIAGIFRRLDALDPTKAEDIVAGEDQSLNEVTIAEFKQLAQEENAVIAETAWVTFVNGDYRYIQNDQADAILVKSGDNFIFNAGTILQGLKLEASLDKTGDNAPVADNTPNRLITITAGEGEFNAPRFESAADVKKDNFIHAMVRLGRSKYADGVLTAPAGTTNTIKVVDKFHKNISIPEDLAYITGIIGKNGNDYEFYPVNKNLLKQYTNIVTAYQVGDIQDRDKEGNVVEAIPAGAERYVTGADMTADKDMAITEDAKKVSEGTAKEMVFTHKAEGDSFNFDATRKGTLTVYLEQQPDQKLSVTEDGEAMKNLTSIAQDLDSLEIPVAGGKQYMLTGTVTPLQMRGFTFRDANEEALDVARNIALFKSLYRDNVATEDTLLLNDAIVTYIHGDDVFVEDATGAIDFHETYIQYYVGQKLNGYIVGKTGIVNEKMPLPALLRTDGTKYGQFKVTDKVTPEPAVISVAAANEKKNLARFVKLENVKVVKNLRGLRMLTDGKDSILIEDHFGVFYKLPNHLKSIEGIIGASGEFASIFWPTSKDGVVEAPTPATFATGKYFLGNYGAGLADEPAYWAAGNDWGTQASLVKHAEYVILHQMAPEGQYQLESQVSNGGDKYYFNGDYMDNNQPMTLTITRTKEPIGYSDEEETIPVYGYYIANGEKYFGWDGEKTVLGKDVDKDSENAIWIIATVDEALASLAEATEDDPADATFLLLDPNFGRNNRNKGAWTGDDFSVGGNNSDFNAEKWGGNSQTFDISQTAEVPNGKYVITWNGFYRYNNTNENTNDVAIAAHADGTEVINSFVYINGKDYPLTSIADEEAAEELSALPFSQAQAGDAFAKGLYTHEAEVIVTDGKLTIGIKKTEHPGTDWTVWDNFELTYYGASMVPSTVNYSWESPNGTVAETGGKATYEHGKEGEDRANYKNADYYTLCLNGKKGNLSDADASANAGYILIALDEELQGGETITITAYINKNESKKSSAWLVFETGATIESAVYSDEANIDPAFNGVPTATTITVPAEAAGSKTIKLTRSQAGTNLFITKLTIEGETGDDPTTGITEVAPRQYEQGAVYSLSGRKVANSVEGLKKGLYIVNGRVVVIK